MAFWQKWRRPRPRFTSSSIEIPPRGVSILEFSVNMPAPNPHLGRCPDDHFHLGSPTLGEFVVDKSMAKAWAAAELIETLLAEAKRIPREALFAESEEDVPLDQPLAEHSLLVRRMVEMNDILVVALIAMIKRYDDGDAFDALVAGMRLEEILGPDVLIPEFVDVPWEQPLEDVFDEPTDKPTDDELLGTEANEMTDEPITDSGNAEDDVTPEEPSTNPA